MNRHIENLILTAFFVGIFLPVRLVFYQHISDYWLGSLGLITGILVVIIILAKKDKMGFIGRLILKKFDYIKTSRLTYYAVFMELLMIIVCVTFLSGLAYEGTPELILAIDELFVEHDIQDLTDPQDFQIMLDAHTKFEPQEYILLVLVALFLPIINWDLYSSIVVQIDAYTDGWTSHILIVWLVSSLEGLGIILYFKFLHGTRHIKRITGLIKHGS